MTSYRVALEVTHVYYVEDIKADSDREAKDLASSQWWNGGVDHAYPNDTYLNDARIVSRSDEETDQ